MAWTMPRTWVAGELISAKIFNTHIRDNLNFLFNTLGYSSGTWVPTLTFDTPGNLAITYATQNGSWNKFNTLVIVIGHVVTSSYTQTTASGLLRIPNYPFTCVSTFDPVGQCTSWRGITKAGYTDVVPALAQGTAIGYFVPSGSGQGPDQIQAGDCPSGGTLAFDFGFTYFSG